MSVIACIGLVPCTDDTLADTVLQLIDLNISLNRFATIGVLGILDGNGIRE